jgi:hypothetical protein
MTARQVLAIMLVALAALFAVGSQIERGTEATAEAKATPAELRHDATSTSETAAARRSDRRREQHA